MKSFLPYLGLANEILGWPWSPFILLDGLNKSHKVFSESNIYCIERPEFNNLCPDGKFF